MSELNDADKQIVESLIGKQDQSKLKYRFDDNFQRRILSLILTDNTFLVQSRPLVEPEYFTAETHVVICKTLFAYFETYRNNPEKFVLKKLIEEKTKDESAAKKLHFQDEFNALYEEFVPTADSRPILLDKVLTFAKTQALKIAMDMSQKDLKKDPESEETWNNIYERFRQAMTVKKSFEMGFECFPKLSDFFAELDKETTVEDKFTSGFNRIDSKLGCGGLRRGEIYSWIGMPGKGKSLSLVKACVENVKLGKKVLYVSLEQGYIDIMKRFISQFALVDHNYLPEQRKEIEDLINLHMRDYEDKNRFIIKQFPSGQADVNDIRAYMTQLELYGFRPDMLIVDYPGEMKDASGIPTWESKYRIMRDLRGMSIEKNMCVLTAMQPNKNAGALGEAEFIDEAVIGGSFDQFKPLDGLWSINQTNEETEAGYGRIFVVKHRSGQSRYSFVVKYDRKSLDIKECSESDYRAAMHNLANQRANVANVDGSGGKKNKKASGQSKQVELTGLIEQEQDYAE